MTPTSEFEIVPTYFRVHPSGRPGAVTIRGVLAGQAHVLHGLDPDRLALRLALDGDVVAVSETGDADFHACGEHLEVWARPVAGRDERLRHRLSRSVAVSGSLTVGPAVSPHDATITLNLRDV